MFTHLIKARSLPWLYGWRKGDQSGAGDPPKTTQLGQGRGKTNEFQPRGPPRAARTLRSVSWVATQLRRHQDGCKERINHFSAPCLAANLRVDSQFPFILTLTLTHWLHWVFISLGMGVGVSSAHKERLSFQRLSHSWQVAKLRFEFSSVWLARVLSATRISLSLYSW